MSYKILKKIFIFLLLTLVNPIFYTAHSLNKDEVSDRELLIMSTLSYCNTVYKDDIPKMVETFLEKHSIYKSLMNPSELEDWKILDYEINLNDVKSSFSIFVFQKGDDIVIVPRGTDNGVFFENSKYLTSNEHPQAKYLKVFLKNLVQKIKINNNLKIYLAGHSLGGYLSLYGTGVLLQIPKIRNHIVKTVTFNGLGLGNFTDPNILKQLYNTTIRCKIINYKIPGDLVSSFGAHITKCITLNVSRDVIDDLNLPHKLPAATAHKITMFFFTNQFKPFKKNNSQTNIINNPIETPDPIVPKTPSRPINLFNPYNINSTIIKE